jgi:hypothetical protein
MMSWTDSQVRGSGCNKMGTSRMGRHRGSEPGIRQANIVQGTGGEM